MKLSQEQRKRVMDNLGLVRKVIQDKVHSPCQLGFNSYDDIYQISCIGLCKAAATDRGGVFSTYAYRLIWHEICSALIYATRRSAEEANQDLRGQLREREADTQFQVEYLDLQELLSRSERAAKGVVAKGICAVQLMAEGYTCREIGERMGANDKNVAAWISKARKYLKADPSIQGLRNSL